MRTLIIYPKFKGFFLYVKDGLLIDVINYNLPADCLCHGDKSFNHATHPKTYRS